MSELEVISTPGKASLSLGVLEQCYDPTTEKAYFYQMDDSLILDGPQMIESIVDDVTGKQIVPLDNGFLRASCVYLPTRPIEYGTEINLYNDVRHFIHKWVEVSDRDENLLTLYSMLTWAYDRCNAIPLISIRGAAETGKTRLGDTMLNICYRGMRTSGSLSKASLYRAVQAWKGTVFLNEMEFGRNSGEGASFVKLLNESYEKTGRLWLVNKDTGEVETFNMFGPRIMATRKGFDDDGLESRCFEIKMKSKTRTDISPNLTDEFFSEALAIRNKLLMFRLMNYWRFEVDTTLRFDAGARNTQILQPLASLARMISIDIFQKVVELSSELNEDTVTRRAESPDGMIVMAYLKLEKTGIRDITPSDIKHTLETMGFDLSLIAIGKRMTSLGFEHYATKDGRKKPYRMPEKERENLMRKYVPKEDRDHLSGPEGSDEFYEYIWRGERQIKPKVVTTTIGDAQ